MSETTAAEPFGSATRTSTSVPDFGAATEASDVATHFSRTLENRIVLITGVNPNGIGRATAEALIGQPASRWRHPGPRMLIIAGRSVEKLEESKRLLRAANPDVEVRCLALDLSSQQSVRRSAAELLSWNDVPRIDILVNSAGVMNLPRRELSADGIELTFATNHIGHFLFTSLVMPKLIEAARGERAGRVRVVNVSSLSPTWSTMRWSDTNFDVVNRELPEAEQPPYDVHRRWGAVDPEDQTYLPLEAYNQSKVANVLFGIALNRRLFETHGILGLAVHPGIIRTELGRNRPPAMTEALKAMDIQWKTLGAGAATTVTAALDPRLGLPQRQNDKENWGSFLVDCHISGSALPLAESSSEAEKLWALSEKLVGQRFDWPQEWRRCEPA